MRTADYEFAGRIHMVLDIIVKQRQYFLVMDRRDDTGHQDINDVVADNAQHLLVRLQLCSFAVIGRLNEIIVLGRNYNRINADRIAVIIIFNGYLALGVRTQIRHHLSFATDIRQHLQDTVGKIQGERHIVFCFVSGITEHHALVARTLFHRIPALHTTVDVGALLMNGGKHATRIALEHILAFGIADFLDYFTRDKLKVNIRFGFHFSSQHYLSGSNQSFASYFRTGVIRQQFVKHSVRYLIGHFVGVSFRHRFGCE